MPTTEAPEETQVDDAQTSTDEKPVDDVAGSQDETAGGESPTGESEAPSWSLRGALEGHGFEFDDDYTDETGFGKVVEYVTRQETAAQHFEERVKHQEQLNAALNAQLTSWASRQPSPTPEPEAETSIDPTFDLSYRDHIDPETNQFRPDTIAQFRDEQARHIKWQHQFQTDPVGTMKRALRSMAEEVAAEVFDERSKKQQTTQSIDAFEEANRSWLYQTDPNGNPVVIMGQSQFSPIGNEFGAGFKRWVAKGLNEGDAANAAMMELSNKYQQPQPSQQAQPTAEEKADSRANLKKAHTDRIKRGGGRTSGSGGTSDSASGPNPVSQNGSSTSFAETLRRNMAEAGITDSDV